MERTIVIGDIHGCDHTLSDLLRKCKATDSDKYIFLGDYIDRGPFSRQVVKRLLKYQSKMGKERVVLLRGNHEQIAIDSDGKLDMVWEANGGRETIKSYQDNMEELEFHIEAFSQMPLAYETDRYIFAHAGLSKPKLADNTDYELLWERDWLTNGDDRLREKTVIFGHSPMKTIPYHTLTFDIGIDGGCVFGGSLCAAILRTGEKAQFVTVPMNPKDRIIRE